MDFKLGKKPYIPKEKDFKYKTYKSGLTALPPLPTSFGLNANISDWGMLGNDQYGDCVFAGAAHAIMAWNAEAGKNITFTTRDVLSDYSAVTGFNPNDPNTDNGAYLRDALDYGRTVGFVDANGNRHKIGAFLLLDILDFEDILQATYIFSDTKLGILLSQTAMNQFNAGLPWTDVGDSQILGGHDVELIGFDGEMLEVVTWGKIQKMSIDFFKKYCDEAYAQLSEEFLVNGLSPDGFNLAQLQADLVALTPTPHNFTITVNPETLSVPIGQEVVIKVTTKDNDLPVSNQTIQVEYSGLSRSNGSAITDSNGIVNFPITCNETGEEYCSFKWIDLTGISRYATSIITYLPNNEEEQKVDNGILIYSNDDFPTATRLSSSLNYCPIFIRKNDKSAPADISKVNKLFIVGGSSVGHPNEILLTGSNWFASNMQVGKYLGSI